MRKHMRMVVLLMGVLFAACSAPVLDEAGLHGEHAAGLWSWDDCAPMKSEPNCVNSTVLEVRAFCDPKSTPPGAGMCAAYDCSGVVPTPPECTPLDSHPGVHCCRRAPVEPATCCGLPADVAESPCDGNSSDPAINAYCADGCVARNCGLPPGTSAECVHYLNTFWCCKSEACRNDCDLPPGTPCPQGGVCWSGQCF